MPSMTRPASYAVGLLHDIHPGPALTAYLTGIDATLAPYGGASSSTAAHPRSWRPR